MRSDPVRVAARGSSTLILRLTIESAVATVKPSRLKAMNMSNACGTISRVSAAAFALLIASVSPAHAQETDEFPVRVTVRTSQLRPDGFGSANWLTGYVDGTAATLKCSQCGQLQPGRFHGRWDKDTLRIRSTGMFGKHKVREDRFEVGLLGPKRDTSWSRDKPVLLTAYGTSEQQCVQPIRLANNVISKIDHPADWRVVIACTPTSCRWWRSTSPRRLSWRKSPRLTARSTPRPRVCAS